MKAIQPWWSGSNAIHLLKTCLAPDMFPSISSMWMYLYHSCVADIIDHDGNPDSQTSPSHPYLVNAREQRHRPVPDVASVVDEAVSHLHLGILREGRAQCENTYHACIHTLRLTVSQKVTFL